jgi:hypothetical protein
MSWSRRDSISVGYEPSPSIFTVDTAVEKPISSFTHTQLAIAVSLTMRLRDHLRKVRGGRLSCLNYNSNSVNL